MVAGLTAEGAAARDSGGEGGVDGALLSGAGGEGSLGCGICGGLAGETPALDPRRPALHPAADRLDRAALRRADRSRVDRRCGGLGESEEECGDHRPRHVCANIFVNRDHTAKSAAWRSILRR